ncbi:MAG: hypothetical protein ACJ8AS_02595 [Hyphomicrobiales bacterium]
MARLVFGRDLPPVLLGTNWDAFPRRCIKTDGTLIRSMRDSRYDRAIVRAIDEIAEEMGVDAVAARVSFCLDNERINCDDARPGR